MDINLKNLSKKAIIYGFLTDYLGSLTLGFLFGMALALIGLKQEILASNIVFISIAGFLGLIMDVAGGFVAAYKAKQRLIVHAVSINIIYLILKISFFLLFILGVHPVKGFIESPSFYGVASFVLAIPFTYAGGILAKKVLEIKSKNYIQMMKTSSRFKISNFKVRRSDFVVVIIIFILIFSLYYSHKYKKEDITLIIDDMINGTNISGNDKLTKVSKQLLDSRTEISVTKYPSTSALDRLNILGYDSMEELGNINKIIQLLETSINELSQAKVKEKEIDLEMLKRGESVTILSKDEKEKLLNDLYFIFNDKKRNELAFRRYESLSNVYKETLKLYKFLKLNFLGYKNGIIENKTIILFDDKKNTAEFNEIVSSIEASRAKFIEDNNNLFNYFDQNYFMKTGSTEKIINSVYK